jgi:NADH-quinone oxidoreductase subunit J
MQNFVFYLSAALIVFCALRCVSSPYIFRSALYLAAALSLTAVQYVLMEAYFVAIVQILVYVGAVIILIVFAVMLTAQIGEGNISQSNALALPAALVSGALGYGLYAMLKGFDFSKVAPSAATPGMLGTDSNIMSIGRALLSPQAGYVFPFEMIGLLLFVALIGAVLIARKDPGQ